MWGNARVGTAALGRPVKRSETRISTTVGPEPHQAGKHNALQIPSCIPLRSSAINNSPRAVVWLAGH